MSHQYIIIMITIMIIIMVIMIIIIMITIMIMIIIIIYIYIYTHIHTCKDWSSTDGHLNARSRSSLGRGLRPRPIAWIPGCRRHLLGSRGQPLHGE